MTHHCWCLTLTGLHSMKSLGVLLLPLDGMLWSLYSHITLCPSNSVRVALPIHLYHLYSRVERGTARVTCLTQWPWAQCSNLDHSIQRIMPSHTSYPKRRWNIFQQKGGWSPSLCLPPPLLNVQWPSCKMSHDFKLPDTKYFECFCFVAQQRFRRTFAMLLEEAVSVYMCIP